MLTARSSLSNGLGQQSKPKLPTIEHPSSRLGDRFALHLSGDNKMGHNIALAGIARPRRERTEPVLATIQSLPNLSKRNENQPWPGGRSLPREDGEMFSYYPRMNSYSADNYILNRGRKSGPKSPDWAAYELSEMIRDKLRTGAHGVKQLFKSNDPTGQGTVTREGLMKVLFSLCGYISSDHYNFLLNRVGLDGKPSVSFEQFVGCFQDTQTYQPQWVHPVARKEIEGGYRPPTAGSFSARYSVKQAPTPNHSPDRSISPPKIDTSASINDEDSQKPKRKPFRTIKKTLPNLERIADCMFYRFEEPYNVLKSGFEPFDYLQDGFVSRMDFRTVLKEFGFPCQAIDIEQFLSKCGVRIQQGLVNYNDFLTRFWNRSETGLVNRIVTNRFHVYSQDQSLKKAPGEYLTSEEMEAAMVDFFHGDFLALLGNLKKCDKDKRGMINQSDLRNAINKVLNTSMGESQWQILLDTIGTDNEGLINYASFLESFNTPPGQWNMKTHNGVNVAKVRQTQLPQEVEELREKAKEEQENVLVEPQGRQDIKRHKLMGRPADQLQQMAREVFVNRFHDFDKAFKRLDRKMTGLFNKDQFRYLLRECGVDMTLIEVDRLGKSMCMGKEGVFSYSAVLRHFIHEQPAEKRHNDVFVPSPVSPSQEELSTAPEDLSESATPDLTMQQEPKREMKRSSQLKATNKTTEPIEKIREDVTSRWEAIKSVLRNIDKAGTSLVTAHEMKELMEMFNFNVTEEECNTIISKFLVSPGSVSYIKFLEYFSTNPSSVMPPNENLTPKEVRTIVRSSGKPTWQRKITQDWKSIKRAFKKADTTNQGGIAVTDFQRILTACGVEVPNETLYNILSKLDPQLTGMVNYETFINHCLTAL